MATINGSTSSAYWTFKLEVAETAVSAINNTSTVQVTAYVGRAANAGASYITGANFNIPITANGSQQTLTYKNSGTINISAGAWFSLGSKAWTVTHNSDGTKTIGVSATFTNSVSPSSGSASGNVTLTNIDRTGPYVTITATVLSSSSLKIKGTANKACNKWEYTLNGTYWATYSTTSGTTAETTITGLASRYYTPIAVRATRTDNGISATSTVTSADLTLPTVSATATPMSSTSIKIRGAANVNCNKWEYTLDGGTHWTTYSTTNGSTAETTITGLASANYTNIKVRAKRTDNGLTNTSGTVSADIRLPTVTLTVSNVTANSLQILASSSATANEWLYSLNNGSTWNQYSTAEGTNANVTVTGLEPNTTYQIKVKAKKKTNSLYGQSSTSSVKTLGASVITNVSTVVIDATAPTVSIRMTVYDSLYTHILQIKQNNTVLATYTILTSTLGTNDIALSLSDEQTDILGAMTTQKEFSATYVLTTYLDGTQIGSPSTFSAVIMTTADNSAPTFTAFTHADTNATTTAVTENNQLYIQGKSTMTISCTAATAKNEASIVSYMATLGDKRVTSSTTTINFGTVKESGKLTVTAIDSRGYATFVEADVVVIPYINIMTNRYSIRRENEVEDNLVILFEGAISPVNVENVAKNYFVQARYRYKRVTSDSWSAYSTIANVTSTSSSFSYYTLDWIDLDSDYDWDIQIEVSDRLSTNTFNVVVNKGKPLVSFRSQKIGVNTNIPQYTLDVDGDINASNSIYANGGIVQGFRGHFSYDLNYLRQPGIYYIGYGQDSDNFPEQNSGILEVFHNADDQCYQRASFVGLNYARVYVRACMSDTWGAWVKIADNIV